MAVTEAEVKRLLADATGKRLHATRLASLERLRAHLVHEPRRSAAVGAAIDGLLALATDAKQSRDLRMLSGAVLVDQINLDALRERFLAWPEVWSTRFRLLARSDEQPESVRLLAAETFAALVVDHPELEQAATDLFIDLVSRPDDPTPIRIVALRSLGAIHRGTPSFFADERRIGGLVTQPIPEWNAWEQLGLDERELVAALADPDALEQAMNDHPAALEAAALHVRWDPSSARALAARIRHLDAERIHASLLRAAVEYDRSQGLFALDWIAPLVVDAALFAARRALARETEPDFDAHTQLWNDLFRDGGRGLADHLLELMRADADYAAAWVALSAVTSRSVQSTTTGHPRASSALKHDTANSEMIGRHTLEGAAMERGLAIVRAAPELKGLDVLIALVAPERVFDLQEEGILEGVVVPTEDELGRLYRDEASRLPRRLSIAHLMTVLKDADDPSRVVVALDLLPAVIRWLPSELARFEPILRKLLQRIDNRQRAIGRLVFDAMIRTLDALTKVAPRRRPPVALAEFARQASIHGQSAATLAASIAKLAPDDADVRLFWSVLVKSRDLLVEKRLDAWRAIDVFMWTDKEDDLGELAEEVLLRTDDPEIGAFLIEPFRRRWPVRFATVAGRLRLPVPPVERVPREAREALALAVSPEETIAQIEGDAPVAQLLGAMLLIRGVVARRPDLRDRARLALAKRIDDPRVYTAVIAGTRTSMTVSAVAFGEHLALDSGDAAQTLARVLAGLRDPLPEDLTRATELARAFAASATSPLKAAALIELERGLLELFARPALSIESVEAILGAYCETIALLGEAEPLRARLERLMGDRTMNAGVRYAAFSVLSAAKDTDRDGLLDAAVDMFMNGHEDPALRALLGGVVTLGKPQAFATIVDMNQQPWIVVSPDDASLPANSLPANMPMSWLVATLATAAHIEPLGRAAREIAQRLVPEKYWEWPRVRQLWLGLVKGKEADVRRGLQRAVQNPSVACLLALFGDAEDEALLSSVAGAVWSEETLADNVFWRPAGKAPAFGRYSFLEPWLEVAFGTPGRYRILSEAYVQLAERAEGGDAARYAYEAFLLGPDNPRATEAMDRYR